MCDTLYIKRNGKMVWGKNSDRSANEPNLIVHIKQGKQSAEKLKCTYIEVSSTKQTNEVLLYKPSWMFGAEMGINEYGVVIGNEAVFTKSKGKQVERLTGMDMLRLALERSKTAKEAVDILIDLLSQYGQGGNCGFDKKFYYDNSFLVADRNSAYIMETSGSNYCVSQCDEVANISNRLSFNTNYQQTNLQSQVDFARVNSEPIFTTFSGSGNRYRLGCDFLTASSIATAEVMMNALRQHNSSQVGKLNSKGSVSSVCMHQSLIGDHTTGSMIVESFDDFDTIWLTGSSLPCMSIYKPTLFGNLIAPVFSSEQDSLKYWQYREYIQRAVFAKIIDENQYKEKINTLQRTFIDEHNRLRASNATKQQMIEFVNQCSQAEQLLMDSYADKVEEFKLRQGKLPKLWRKKMKSFNGNVFSRNLNERKV